MRSCWLCGQDLPAQAAGRRRRYCSRACQQRAYRLREQERLWRPKAPAAPADPAKVTRLLGAALHKPRS